MNASDWSGLAGLSGIMGVLALIGGLYASVYQECSTFFITICRNPYQDYSGPLIILGVVGIAVALVSSAQASAERRHQESLRIAQPRVNTAPSVGSVFCSSCGRPMEASARFCSTCGKPNLLL